MFLHQLQKQKNDFRLKIKISSKINRRPLIISWKESVLYELEGRLLITQTVNRKSSLGINDWLTSPMFSPTMPGCRTSLETPTGSRRNSYRNQIDYILVRKYKGTKTTNAHSYGGMMTPSEHKLVMMSCKMKWPFLPRMKHKARVNLE